MFNQHGEINLKQFRPILTKSEHLKLKKGDETILKQKLESYFEEDNEY